MQQDITKLCSDSLRAFTQDTYGIKLKASHAHELVAAFFGYKSRAALLTDTQQSLDNLRKVEFFIFDPTPSNTGFIDQRLKDFGYKYLNAFHLSDCFYSTLRAEKWFSKKFYVSFQDLAVDIAGQYQQQRLRMFKMKPDDIEWEKIGDLRSWTSNGDALLTADIGYLTNAGELLRDSTYVIHLPRIAANLGYGIPRVEETLYSGNARRMDFPDLKTA